MTNRQRLGLVSCAMLLVSNPVVAQTPEAPGTTYLTPPQVIVDILDAPRSPTVVVGPLGDRMALLYRNSMPTIADLAEPMLRLAGMRINPRTNGMHQPNGVTRVALKRIADGSEAPVALPAEVTVQSVQFSPDGRHVALTVAHPQRIALWVADTATGRARAVTDAPLNAVGDKPCGWTPDSRSLLCRFVVESRGPVPSAPAIPSGPNIQENLGRAAPVPTFQDLLETAHDEALFEYYAMSQLALVDVASGQRSLIGEPAMFDEVELSPGGEFVLVARMKRPFSRLVPARRFAKDVEVWNRTGGRVASIADLPLAENVPILGVPTGPRNYEWKPTDPATVVWVEALDEGDLRNPAPHRDRIMTWSAPFTGTATELARTEHRFDGLSWTERGVALLTESERSRRRLITWVVEGSQTPRKLWDRGERDAYAHPGSPLTRSVGIETAIAQEERSIFLAGNGASPSGDRPFLDRLNLDTFETERIFRSDDTSYETVVSLLAAGGRSVLTRHESQTSPPNYRVRDLVAGSQRVLTAFPDPSPQLRGVTKQLITYTRSDGVELSATLYLPPGSVKGQRLPVLLWAYPREFVDPSTASQVTGSPNRFTLISGASHLLFLTQGYAVLDDAAMPVVGSGETANDTYVQQLVASAQAAVDAIVEMGVADRDRIGVGGHSYGAFMTANLLAHSDIFRAGIARSGAYNRTLTPFGFQNERRTFWEVPEIYGRMSPFFHADKINEPILLTHGEADNNSGTFPIQSERLYMALKGHGATVRYVTLPLESHGYAARESVLHTVAEMLNWADKYVKDAQPRALTESASR